MSTNPSFESVWGDYLAAVRDLYRSPGLTEAAAERSAGRVPSRGMEDSGLRSEVVHRSEAVRQVLETGVASQDLNQSLLASLKLLAAAATDLSVAVDLLAFSEGEAFEAERSGSDLALTSSDLREVMEAPLESGIAGLLEPERAALPTDLTGAKAAMENAITGLLRCAPENAAGPCQTSAVELGSIGFGPVKSSLSLVIDMVLDKLQPEFTAATRSAGLLVIESIQKLRAAIGKENEQAIYGKAAEWAEQFEKNRGFVSTLLDGLYETKRIGQEAAETLAKAPATLSPDAFNQATEKLTLLQVFSDKTNKTLNILLKVLSLAKAPLLAVTPWGPLGVVAAYLSIVAYAVYTNGDVLDWHRTGQIAWLDRIEGLRTILNKSLLK